MPATCSNVGSYDEVVYCTVCSVELSRKAVIIPVSDKHVPGEAVIENRVAGNFGCNQMLGSYELKSENSIRLELGGTRRMCADMAVEDLFSAKLNSVDQYKIEGDTLYLMTKGSPILKFVAK